MGQKGIKTDNIMCKFHKSLNHALELQKKHEKTNNDDKSLITTKKKSKLKKITIEKDLKIKHLWECF